MRERERERVLILRSSRFLGKDYKDDAVFKKMQIIFVSSVMVFELM